MTVALTSAALAEVAQRFREPVHVLVDGDGTAGAAFGGASLPDWTLLGTLPALYPEWLGDRGFAQRHGTRFAYVVGEMANGIATTRMVVAAARAGCLGIFGAAGLAPARVEHALGELSAQLGSGAWGSNLIHSPQEPQLEQAVADLYVARGVPCVSASAYMSLTPAVAQCAYAGLRRAPDGSLHRARRMMVKVSREEVARQFMEPAPGELLAALVASGRLTAEEAQLAAELPVAEDITVESDSGGHTDNRPLGALLPAIARLRRYPVRIGAAGGLGTPAAVAAAFALGADYVLTGSVNQACVESGLHADARAMLAQAGVADVTMAPAADMFELGVDVQVLARGTMFAVRARRLRQLFSDHASLEALPAGDRQWLESQVLQASLEQSWEAVSAFWSERDPAQLTRAAAEPRHRMALVMRSYLGRSSRWAIDGEPARRTDFQIWCGPAMGAFNGWAQGSFLADPARRTVAQVAANLLEGATAITRAQQLRAAGVAMPTQAFDFRPRPMSLGDDAPAEPAQGAALSHA